MSWRREAEVQVRIEARSEGCTCEPVIELHEIPGPAVVADIQHKLDCPLCDAGLSPIVGELGKLPPQ